MLSRLNIGKLIGGLQARRRGQLGIIVVHIVRTMLDEFFP